MSGEVRFEQGVRVSRDADSAEFEAALLAAVDYRGDVTVETSEGVEQGFLFDYRPGEVLRLIPADGEGRRSVAIASVRAIEFSGKDAASGKTWENWVRRYVERKRAGLAANIESESLDPS